MTTDEAIAYGRRVIDLGLNDETQAFCEMALNIMQKYQKIKKQVDIAIDKENFAISDARLIQIREFINGNDD